VKISRAGLILSLPFPARHMRSCAVLTGCLLLTACFDMPHPFSDPGENAKRLAGSPPPSRLDIPLPKESGLSPEGAEQWSHYLATMLLQKSVPAIAQDTRKGDWWLRLRVDHRGDQVIPVYEIMTPTGQVRATEEGSPLSSSVWTSSQPAILQAAAVEGSSQIVQALTGIQAAGMEADPHSLKHRPAKIWFSGVTGAPGDGNISLAQAFIGAMRGSGDTVRTADGKDTDFKLHVTVKLTDQASGTGKNPQQLIEISWRVTDSSGNEVGIATQLHEIEAHSLDGYWGDVAVAAAQEAASAVEEMISRYSGRKNQPLPDPNGKTHKS
jgi:hypothetical protein